MHVIFVDLYEFMNENHKYFDAPFYLNDHPSFSDKKVKDKLCSIPIRVLGIEIIIVCFSV